MKQSKAAFKKILIGMTASAVMMSNRLTTHAADFVEIFDEEIPMAITTNNGCYVHWIIVVMMAVYTVVETIRTILRKNRLIKKKEFIPAGIYVVAIMLVLAFGICEADIFVAVGGLLVGLAGVICTIMQAKKAVAQETQAE